MRPRRVMFLRSCSMTPEALAALQARAYRHMAPWPASGFADLLELPTTRLITAPHGFLLARVVSDEAEILSLATDPEHQRQGIASGLLDRFETRAAAEGVLDLFLDVAGRNIPARSFYAAKGYVEAGLRRSYYKAPDGTRDDAVLMRRALTLGHAT